MIYRLTVLLLPLCSLFPAARAQQPLYIVNGTPTEEIRSIPPSDIERIEELPADEETVARYGDKANGGVILVTLRYDTPAHFDAPDAPDESFDKYVARRIRWEETDPPARVTIRYTIGADGRVEPGEVIESTDSRLRRRVLKFFDEAAAAPLFRPAMRDGAGVASQGVLHVHLPEGSIVPPAPAVIIR